MNGIHDLGGMHGFGRIRPEANEPVFHHEWEKKIFGMVIATMAQRLYNVDEFRHGIEQMDPAEYLSSSYYEHWLATMEKTLAGKGVISANELKDKIDGLGGQPDAPAARHKDPALATRLMEAVKTGGSTAARAEPKARFKAGDKIVTRNEHPHGHTRLPRYARGKRGVVKRVHGSFIFPDTNAHGKGRDPQHVYTVKFTGRELWGESSEAKQILYLDLWERYLKPA